MKGVLNLLKNTLFKTELAYDEFKHLLELDYKKEWFNEVKQIIQVNLRIFKSLRISTWPILNFRFTSHTRHYMIKAQSN